MDDHIEEASDKQPENEDHQTDEPRWKSFHQRLSCCDEFGRNILTIRRLEIKPSFLLLKDCEGCHKDTKTPRCTKDNHHFVVLRAFVAWWRIRSFRAASE